MNILHIAHLDNRKTTGPNINVPQIIIHSKKYGNVALFNISNMDPPIKLPEKQYFSIKKNHNIKTLLKPFDAPDIVVFQGVYYLKYCIIANRLKREKIPYIIVPRCSMTTAAIKSHFIKKKIANILFFNNFIKNASAIQFLTDNEYKESKDNFEFKDHFVIGNGTIIPTLKYSVKKRKEYKIIFMGRYNIYHKGLDILLDAIKIDKEWFLKNNISLLLYGSDSDNGRKYLEQTIKTERLENIVKICGPVYDTNKERAYLDADIFIHTSRLEGQPTSVIEAISYGIPIIVTPGTNMSEIVDANGLGFICDFDKKSILSCIKKAYRNKKQYHAISKNEIKYADHNFNWDSVAKKSIRNYERYK